MNSILESIRSFFESIVFKNVDVDHNPVPQSEPPTVAQLEKYYSGLLDNTTLSVEKPASIFKVSDRKKVSGNREVSGRKGPIDPKERE